MRKIKPTKKRADKLWSMIIRKRNNGRCEVCQGEGQNCHHIIGRRNLGLRFDLRNGILLCFTHHLGGSQSAHNDPIWFLNWLSCYRPDDYQYLEHKQREIIKVNYAQVIEKLKKDLED